MLRCRQAERSGKGHWNTEQFNVYLGGSYEASIAHQSLFPREPEMGTLCT